MVGGWVGLVVAVGMVVVVAFVPCCWLVGLLVRWLAVCVVFACDMSCCLLACLLCCLLVCMCVLLPGVVVVFAVVLLIRCCCVVLLLG